AGVKAVAKGFATSVGDEVITEKGIMDIQHGRTFVLLDKGAHIRGFYHPDAAGMAKLEHDVRSLSNRP
ncbi:MAG: hypothetical protein FJZ00_01270, partial [Candidatus Sericytochromatia bacterium]|nr:hypothetical protein [Candidatus Tanganyikabacteria bacterium]